MNNATGFGTGLVDYFANKHVLLPPCPSFLPQWEYITPAIAIEYLALNHERNRKKKIRFIARMASMLTGGRYRPTHQGIAFNEQGKLIDGRNRLEAIVEANTGAWVLVTRNVPHAHVTAIDAGTIRTDTDQMTIGSTLDINEERVSVARAMRQGLSSSSSGHYAAGPHFKDDVLKEFLERNWEAICFVSSGDHVRGVTAVVLGIVAKAYYYADKDELARFLKILRTGETSMPYDCTAVRLRDLCREGKLTVGGLSKRAILARKVCYALVNFLEKKSVNKIFEYDKDLDPWILPEDRITESGEDY